MKKHWRAVASAVLAATTLTAAADNGVTGSSITLGETIGINGIIAGPVREMIQGAQAYFSMVNKQGGVHGRKIEVRVMDDKFDPATAAANAEYLIRKENVFALFQSRGTPHTEAILPVLAAYRVPLVAPGTGAAIFHQPASRWVFNVRAKYQDEIAKGVEYFVTGGQSTIGLLHVNDSFGRDGLQGFTAAMAARKLKPAIVATFERVTPDYNAAAAQIIQANPGALILVSSAENTSEVIKAIRRQGGKMQIMALSNNSSQSFVKALGPAGIGVVVSQITPPPNLPSTALGQEFKSLANAGEVTMSYAAMEGFVNAKVMVEGLRRAGRNLTREGFIRAMESMQDTDFGGLTVNYGPDGRNGSSYVELTMIGKDGRFVR